MDTDLIKTFLEVNRTRHFGKAANNLFLTQSAVSARIRQLEQQLGVPLFTRERNNIQLTQTGQKLVSYAEAMMSVWTRARAEIAIDTEQKTSLSIGAMPGIWDVFLMGWVQALHEEMPDIILSTDALGSADLRRRIVEHTLDLAFLFEASAEPELEARECFSVDLQLVSTTPGLTVAEAMQAGYVLVDWGTRVSVLHARHFQDIPTPVMRTGLSRIARDFILACGGSAYLARTMIEADVDAGRLHRVSGAPHLTRTVYATYHYGNERRELIERALTGVTAAR